MAGAVKGKEWQRDAFRRERRGEETHITKARMINELEMRKEFTYALGEGERMFTSFLHDKCRQETRRKALLISGTKRFFSPQDKPVQVSCLKLLLPACPLQRSALQAPPLSTMSQCPLSPAPPLSPHRKWKRVLKTANEENPSCSCLRHCCYSQRTLPVWPPASQTNTALLSPLNSHLILS